jgi:DNA repair protein SbcC/Rad50
MILRSITVQGWRCYADSVTIGPLTDTINVIHAPNGTGKSTLFEAMTRALFDSHRVSGDAIDRVRPWGRMLAPAVTVEFSRDGTEYRLFKRFLEDKETKLHRKEGEQWVLLAESDQATEFLRGLLLSEPPGRGASDARHWGIGQILWAAQGELPLVQPSESVLAAIKQSLGVQVAGQSMGQVESRVADIYRTAFTDRGEYKKGKQAPEIVRLLERLGEATEELAATRQKLTDFEEASRKVEDLRARRRQLTESEAPLIHTLVDARSRALVYQQALGHRKTCVAEEAAAKTQYEQVKDRIEAFTSATKGRADAHKKSQDLHATIKTLKAEVETAESRLNATTLSLANVQQRKKDVEAAQDVAELAREYVAASETAAAAEKLAQEIEGIQAKLKTCQDRLTGLGAPDKKTLNAIRKAIVARDDALTRLDASLIHLEITPTTKVKLKTLTGEGPESRKLDPDQTITVKGSPQVVVEAEGFGTILARGPSGSVEGLRESLKSASDDVQRLTRPFETTDLGKLESLREEADGVQEQVKEYTGKLEGLLGDRTLDDIREELQQKAKTCTSILTLHPDWKASPPDPKDLRRVSKELEREHADQLSDAQGECDLAQKASKQATKKVTDLEQQLATAEAERSGFERQIREIESDGLDAARRQQELKKLALQSVAKAAAAEDAATKLAEFPQDPAKEVDSLQRQLDGIQKQVRDAADAERTATGRLQQLADDGAYSRQVELANEIDALQQQIHRDEVRLGAIKLLHESLLRRHSAVAAAVAKPVADKATGLLHRIAGSRLGAIALEESFNPSALTPAVSATPVTIDDLSGGETEQVHLAVRLALASQIADGERQLVVLDDVLTATDAGRLARIQTILDELAQRLQIVILTCHPERYGGLTDANIIDLEACVR